MHLLKKVISVSCGMGRAFGSIRGQSENWPADEQRSCVSAVLTTCGSFGASPCSSLIHGCYELPLDLKQKRKQECCMVEGPPETLHTSVEAKYLSSHGAAKGWSTNNVCLGDLRVSHCDPFIRADQGLLWGSARLQNRGERGFSFYGFEGAFDLQGGGATHAKPRIKLPPASGKLRAQRSAVNDHLTPAPAALRTARTARPSSCKPVRALIICGA